ncbi:MAG: type III-A CRISPR-associated protein Cas10/Csm1, partial [Flammeovirgaceae bacterium]
RDSMSNEELDLSQPIFEIPDDGKVRKLSAEAVQETGGESRKLIGAVSKDLIDLGSELTHLHYLAISPEPTKTKRGYNPCSLGIYYHILAQKDLKDLSTYSNQIELRCINQFSPNVQAKLGTSTSFYGGNETPTIAIQKSNGKVLEMAKTFSEMAGQKDDSRSYAESFHALAFTRLGVLRMDVDGLGAVFSQGQFAQNKRTLSRYATLSHSLDFFFKGYLNKIWEEDEQLYKYSQIIYAGGDDLFIVGRWDLLISFAEKIQQAFRTWSCGNTKLGISGGLAIVTPKFPIAKAADMSGEAEKAAKSHDYGDEIWKKNSITLFGKPLHWEHEYPIVKALKEEILALNKAVIGPLGKIQSYYVKSAVAHQEGAVELENNQQGDLAWRWQLAYHITRAAERYKKDQAFCTFLKKIKNNIFIGKDPARKSWNTAYEYFELLSLAIRWAELERRTTR